MTEAEWLECDDPQKMLEAIHHHQNPSARKLKLFEVACCRRIWHLLPDPRSQNAVELAEKFADGLVTLDEMRVMHSEANDVHLFYRRAVDKNEGLFGYYNAADAAYNASYIWEDPREAFRDGFLPGYPTSLRAVSAAANETCSPSPNSGGSRDVYDSAHFSAEKAQASSLRCIFGNLFRPDALDLSWCSNTSVSLAQAIYDDRDFDRLPILADALEEAGCTSTDILEHCRSGGEHVRGCWVVDLILGKE